MLDYLTQNHGLTREEAYVLCSVAADVRVHEVVDQPNWVVGTTISRDIFTGREAGFPGSRTLQKRVKRVPRR